MEQNRWKNFTKREQIMMIGAEFMRAKTWQHKNPSLRSGTLFPNGNKDQDKFHLALERALELIDLTLSDDKWRDNTLALLRLRDEVAKFYVAERTDDISFLYKAL